MAVEVLSKIIRFIWWINSWSHILIKGLGYFVCRCSLLQNNTKANVVDAKYLPSEITSPEKRVIFLDFGWPYRKYLGVVISDKRPVFFSIVFPCWTISLCYFLIASNLQKYYVKPLFMFYRRSFNVNFVYWLWRYRRPK